MAPVASYAASIELLSRYVRERLPARIFVPLSLFLAAAAGIGAGASDLAGYVLRSGVAFTLVLQFRLWDDLESLVSDRIAHPWRLLCRMPDPVLVFRLLPILAAINLAFVYGLSSNWTRPVLLLVLVSLFALGYHLARRVRLRPLGASHLLLLKYPMFVWILSPPRVPELSVPLLLAMAAVFLSFAIHEILHDDGLRSAPGAMPLAVAESVFVIAVLTTLALLHYRQASDWTAALLLQWVCAAVAAVLVVRLARSSRPALNGRLAYWFFVAGYPALLVFPSSMST